MKLLFVKSEKFGSRLIRWGLRSDCSHFAVCFDEEKKGGGIVFHSSARGATLEWFGLFKQHYEISHALSFKTKRTLLEEEEIYLGLLSKYSGEGYDYKALLFWFFRAVLWRFFRVPLPKENSWAVNGYNLCTGLASGIPWVKLWAEGNDVDLEMIPPHELYIRLLASGYFKSEGHWCDLVNGRLLEAEELI